MKCFFVQRYVRIVVKTVVHIRMKRPVVANDIMAIAKDGDELMHASLGVMEAATLVPMVSIALHMLALHEHPFVETRMSVVKSRTYIHMIFV